jgi:hypothetical protein
MSGNLADFISYRQAIESKPKKPIEDLNKFNSFISNLQLEQAQKEVLPVFVASIKKNPDDAIFTFAHFISLVNFDSSPFLIEFFGLLKDHLQSKYESVSIDAQLCFQKLIQLCQNSDVLLQVSSTLLSMPPGSLPTTRKIWADSLREIGLFSFFYDFLKEHILLNSFKLTYSRFFKYCQ